MEKILLKPVRSEIQYQGRFDYLNFGPLTNPADLYQKILNHLGKYGVTLQNITYIAPPAAEANVSCFLTQLNTTSQFRLDRMEIYFLRFHEVGPEVAQQILLDTWAALHEVDSSIKIAEHTSILNVYTQIQEASYDQVLRRYVAIPPEFGEVSHAGVVFYLPEDLSRGQRISAIILDRVLGPEQNLLLKVTAAFDAERISLSSLSQEIKGYLDRYLSYLGLELDEEEVQ